MPIIATTHAPARPCPCLSFCHLRRGPASHPHRHKHPQEHHHPVGQGFSRDKKTRAIGATTLPKAQGLASQTFPQTCHPDPEHNRRGRICFPPPTPNLGGPFMRDASSAHGWGSQTARTTCSCPCLSFCHPRRGSASRPHRHKHPQGPPPPGRVTASAATKKTRAKATTTLPKAGVQAQPKRLNCLLR